MSAPSSASGPHPQARLGLALALSAYVIWGLSPFYWNWFSASALEIVSHRAGWGLLVLAPLLMLRGVALRPLFTARRLKWAAIGGGLIASNWLVFIWATTNGHVLEASLGYFIGPLVNVALGVALLGERLRRAQMAAIALAAVGVAVPVIAEGRLPVIALYLAFSFSLYALVRRQLDVDGAQGLFLECVLIAPIGLFGVIWFEASGQGHFFTVGWQPLLLVSAGVVFTAGILMLFIEGARRLSFSTLGLLQYVVPTLQFLSGLALGEAFPPARAAAFGLIWAALAIYTFDVLRHERAEYLKRRATSPVG